MALRIFGHIPGYPEDSLFENRAELSKSRVHVPLQAGIAGSQADGAESIVLSGGYEDDVDHGDTIIYTGHGGRDPGSGRQVRDQPFTHGNRALAYNAQTGLPVRVIRGSGHDSPFSPAAGYSYDGLYAVEDYWRDRGRSGFLVWRFRLVKIPRKVMLGQKVGEEAGGYAVAPRREVWVSRLIRDTGQTKRIKALYGHRCQMCGTRLECPAGPYSEAAHIRPLGAPHDGPDTADNILCLCPNHHVLFDLGAISVADDMTLIGKAGNLTVHRNHGIGEEHLRYHRDHLAVLSCG